MLDFCGQDYNPTSHETDFKRSADTIQINAVNIQVSAVQILFFIFVIVCGMNSEEFDIFCNNQDKELAEAIARQKKFMADVEASLIKVAFTLYPQVKKHKKHFAKLLKQEAHEQALSITELLDYYLYMPSTNSLLFDDEKNKIPDSDKPYDDEEQEEWTMIVSNCSRQNKQLES